MAGQEALAGDFAATGRHPDPAAIKVMARGLTFPEMPRWHDGAVHCVNGPEILRFEAPASGHLPGSAQGHVHARLPVPMVLGLSFEPDGSLLAAAVGERRIYRITGDGRAALWLDLSDLVASPLNEILRLPGEDGWLIGNMGFDLRRGETPRSTRLIHVAPDGRARFTGPDVVFPNGMDIIGGKLVVAESFAARISVMRLGEGGDLGSRCTLRDVSAIGGHPDGLCDGGDGSFWYADAHLGTVSRVSLSGRVLDCLQMPMRHALACCLDDTGRRLFVVGTERMPSPDTPPGPAGSMIAIDLDLIRN